MATYRHGIRVTVGTETSSGGGGGTPSTPDTPENPETPGTSTALILGQGRLGEAILEKGE